jgi:hypothetical protein
MRLVLATYLARGELASFQAPVFGIRVTFQQLFLYDALPRCFRTPRRIWTSGERFGDGFVETGVVTACGS